jgi:hypothetical protein
MPLLAACCLLELIRAWYEQQLATIEKELVRRFIAWDTIIATYNRLRTQFEMPTSPSSSSTGPAEKQCSEE